MSTNEYRVTAIVINAINYKERDKIVTLFTLELGKITAMLRGVNSSKSKMKFASQMFYFGVFELVKRGEFFIITQTNAIDNFYNITKDYEVFEKASSIIKMCNKYIKSGVVLEDVFLSIIHLLKAVTYEGLCVHLAVSKFILVLLSSLGYELDFNTCSHCDTKLYSGHVSLNHGGLVCDKCFNFDETGFSKQEFGVLKIINNTPEANLKSIKVSQKVSEEIRLRLVNYKSYLLNQ